jgi:two-component system sensor histidine kinase VicK
MSLKESVDTAVLPYLQGGGEMGKLIRSIDWSQTPIGPAESWPATLKIAVGILLSTPFPMYIAWGSEYIQLYNDGYRPILGAAKHPQAMGISTCETFPEIYHIVGPMFDDVMKGNPVWAPNFMYVLERNGFPEECFFDFSYSPIRDENGEIGGVLVTVIESTEKIKAVNNAEKAKQKLELAQAETTRQRDRLNQFLMQAPAGICVLDGPEFIFELVNPLYQQLFPGRDLLGKPVIEAIPETKGQPIMEILQNVYTTGKTFEGNQLLIPLARTDDGPVEDRYFNFIYQARLDNDNDKVDGILVFVFEVTEMVLADRELSKIQDSLKMAITSAQLGTFDMDLKKGTMDWDLRCRTLFGISHNEPVTYEKDFLPGLHPEDRERVEILIRNVFVKSLTNGDYDVEYRTIGAEDKKQRWVRAMGKAYFDENDVPLRFVGSVIDITQLKAQEEQKDEFISIASHELKTPLTSIKAFNQLMSRTNDGEKLQGFVQKSGDHIMRLEKLITDLLDVTKIKAGKMNYVMQPFNFRQLLEDSIESVQLTTPTHLVTLEMDDDITYTGDQLRLEQVVNNFLNNAVKYSPDSNKIIVKCRLELDNIIVSVQDFGIGIAPESLNRLFERYYRVDNTAMRFQGLGLGLFISSEILKRHQGSFWIESELGKGATFFFRLPLSGNKKPMPVKNSDTWYHDSTITIIYNNAKSRLDVDWTGFQNLESVQHGCRLILKMMQINNVYKIINDNTHVLGSWSEAVEWTGNEWFPMMEKAGLKYFALIYSPSVFSQLSARKSMDVGIGNITAQYFTEIKLAEEWVDSCVV